MTEWVLKASAAAVVLTAAGYILPKGNIKNTAMLAFGFIFLTVLLPPLGNIAESFISERYALELEKNALTAQMAEGSVMGDIMAEYKKRISDEIVSALGKMSVSCKNVSVSVDESQNSETFGYVLAVSCEIYASSDEKKGSVDKVKVPEIIIDLDGIRIEDDTDKDAQQNEHIQSVTQSVIKTISDITGANAENIHVKWSE